MQRNFLWTPVNDLGTKWPRKWPSRSHKAFFDSHTTQPGLTGLHTKHKSNRRKWVSPNKLQTISNSCRPLTTPKWPWT